MSTERNPGEDLLDAMESILSELKNKTPEEVETLFNRPEMAANLDKFIKKVDELEILKERVCADTEEFEKKLRAVAGEYIKDDVTANVPDSAETKQLLRRNQQLKQELLEVHGNLNPGEPISKEEKGPPEKKKSRSGLKPLKKTEKWKKM